MPKIKTPDMFIRRTPWHGFRPSIDRGLWVQVHILWWTIDIFPQDVSASFARQVDSMRETGK